MVNNFALGTTSFFDTGMTLSNVFLTLCLQSDGEKQGELHGQQESRHMLVAHPTPGTLFSKMPPYSRYTLL
jgi:hypothetical protein